MASTSSQCTAPDPTPYLLDQMADEGSGINQRAYNMLDMLVIAFQCDLTRVATMALSTEITNMNIKSYNPNYDADHHDIGHYTISGIF